MNEDLKKLIVNSFSGLDYSFRARKTYVVYLPPLAKALLEETNRKYQFYEFVISNTSALTHTIVPSDRRRIYVKIPAWIYGMAKEDS